MSCCSYWYGENSCFVVIAGVNGIGMAIAIKSVSVLGVAVFGCND